MRSALVFAAVEKMPSRYQLVQTVAKGARKLHQGDRMQKERLADTINEVLLRIAMPDEFELPEEEEQEQVLWTFPSS